MIQNTYEGAHESCIDELIREFGDEREEEIRILYNTQRAELEGYATIRTYLPIFIYRYSKDALITKYGLGSCDSER